jgi:hypothetical protein
MRRSHPRGSAWATTSLLLALLLGGAQTAVLAEGVARLLLPSWRPSTAERGHFWQPHPVYGWSHRPGEVGRFTGPSWDVEVRINDQGLRDVEHAVARSSEASPRVLLLGDSFGWGFGVENDEMLSARLAQRCPSREFINASVSGWGSDQQYLYYREEGKRYQPETVVMLIYGNDLVELSSGRMYGYPKPYFVAQGKGLALRNVPVPERSVGQRIYTELASNSFVVNRLLSVTRIGVAIDVAGLRKPNLVVNELLLRGFAQELRRAGVELRWVLVPMDPSLSKLYRAIARAEGVPILDLSPVFAEAAEGETLTLPGDPHWNAAGHRLAARAVASDLGCATSEPVQLVSLRNHTPDA